MRRFIPVLVLIAMCGGCGRLEPRPSGPLVAAPPFTADLTTGKQGTVSEEDLDAIRELAFSSLMKNRKHAFCLKVDGHDPSPVTMKKLARRGRVLPASACSDRAQFVLGPDGKMATELHIQAGGWIFPSSATLDIWASGWRGGGAGYMAGLVKKDGEWALVDVTQTSIS